MCKCIVCTPNKTTKLLENFIHPTLAWSDVPERVNNKGGEENKREWESHLVDVLVQLGVEDRLSEQHDRLRAAHRREPIKPGRPGSVLPLASPAQGS